MTEEQFIALCRSKYPEIKKLNDLKDFYEYEKKFDGIITELSRTLLESNFSEVPADRRKKNAQPVWERIGRAKQKYPSVPHYYHIEVTTDPSTQKATALHWEKDYSLHQSKQSKQGIYFLRTDLQIKDEVVVWNIYNTIREIENTFHTLKTDLDLRPIYHKTDKTTMAHLHLGLLAYWLVNTIRSSSSYYI